MKKRSGIRCVFLQSNLYYIKYLKTVYLNKYTFDV